MKNRKPRAKHVVLISVDGLQPIYYLDDARAHPDLESGPAGAGLAQPAPRAIRGRVGPVVSIILEVLERTKTWDDTAVIVTGDRGNTEVHTQIRPNV